MGVANFAQLIKEAVAHAEAKREAIDGLGCVGLSPDDLRAKIPPGSTIAVDVSVWANQFSRKCSNEDGEVDEDEVVQSFCSRAAAIANLGLALVFVFDGDAPESKRAELERRRAREKKLREAGRARDSARPSPGLFLALRAAAASCGHGVVSAPGEAEAECARLNRRGDVWGVASEDSDTLAFGAPRLLRGLTARGLQTSAVRLLVLDTVLERLGLSFAQFIDVCILCGTDYTGTVKGVGAKRALGLIREHRTIEGVLQHLRENRAAKATKRRRLTTGPAPAEQAASPAASPAEQAASPAEQAAPPPPEVDDIEQRCDYRLARREFHAPRVHTGALPDVLEVMPMAPPTRFAGVPSRIR